MSPDASAQSRPLPLERYHGYYIEDLAVGMNAYFGKTVTDADIVLFSGVSGDTNPLHLNRDFATGTRFGGPIVHGMLTASFISTVIGTRITQLSENPELTIEAPAVTTDDLAIWLAMVEKTAGGTATGTATPYTWSRVIGLDATTNAPLSGEALSALEAACHASTEARLAA